MNLSEGRAEELERIAKAAEDVLVVIGEALNYGAPMTVSCKKRGISYTRFRRFCEGCMYIREGGRKKDKVEALNGGITFEERLYAKVFGVKEWEACDLMPEDAEETVGLVLSGLSERERLVLTDRVNGKSLEAVGEEYGVSRERARQIEGKAMRKLRRSERSRRLLLGDAGLADIAAEFEKKKEDAMLVYEKILAARDDLVKRVMEIVPSAGVDIKEPAQSIEIETVDFTVRAYNVLRRAGIKTLGDLAGWSKVELMARRNMGRRTLNEVEGKLESFGLSLREK